MKTLGEVLRDKINASIEKRQQLERDFWTVCLDVYATRPAWIDISGWSDAKLISETKAMGDPSCDIHQLLNKHEQLN
jgi:hypothetical protein